MSSPPEFIPLVDTPASPEREENRNPLPSPPPPRPQPPPPPLPQLSLGVRLEAAKRQKSRLDRTIHYLRKQYEEEQELKRLEVELIKKRIALERMSFDDIPRPRDEPPSRRNALPADLPPGWRICRQGRERSPSPSVRRRTPDRYRSRSPVRRGSPDGYRRRSPDGYRERSSQRSVWDLKIFPYERTGIPCARGDSVSLSAPMRGRVELSTEGIWIVVSDQREVIGIAYSPGGAPMRAVRFWDQIIGSNKDFYFCQVGFKIPTAGGYFNRAMIFPEFNDEEVQLLVWNRVIYKDWSHDIHKAPYPEVSIVYGPGARNQSREKVRYYDF